MTEFLRIPISETQDLAPNCEQCFSDSRCGVCSACLFHTELKAFGHDIRANPEEEDQADTMNPDATTESESEIKPVAAVLLDGDETSWATTIEPETEEYREHQRKEHNYNEHLKGHKEIDISFLEGKRRGRFADAGHDALWLAHVVEFHSRHHGQRLPTPRQSEAVCRFYSRKRKMDNAHGADYTKITQYELKRYLKVYRDLFDDLFFFGSLRKRIAISLVSLSAKNDRPIVGLCSLMKRRRITVHRPFLNMKSFCLIEIFEREQINNMERPTRLKFYAETLLHEMIHAFLGLWGCRYLGCYNHIEREGNGGHGVAFQIISMTVEKMVVEFMCLELDMDNVQCLYLDIWKSLDRIPAQDSRVVWSQFEANFEEWKATRDLSQYASQIQD